MAVWLTTVNGERYQLVIRGDQEESRAIISLIDGVGSPANKGWAIVRRHGAPTYLNLRHVERIERAGDDGPPVTVG